ncbi:FG-GAP repeat domain-containing protein [Amycolatopsis sp. NPDC001319]|uniref:FG-GAP repeat domain-containing protein n=1 Tax=unclassified Amycolatopsis TaxID=2618356 RepID=UPI0036A074AF
MKKSQLVTAAMVLIMTGSSVAVAGAAAAHTSTTAQSVTLPTLSAPEKARGLLRSAHAGPMRDRAAILATGRGDITGDGVPDLVTIANGTNTLDVHAGARGGSGAFTTSTTIGTSAADRIWMGQGDLTGDGNNDILTFSSDGAMRINAHSGTFSGTSTLEPEFTWTTGWQAGSLFVLSDFVGKDPNDPTTLDGLADVLFRYSGDNGYYLYVNEGPDANGIPQLSNRGKLLDSMQAVTSVELGDETGDGFPDFYMTFTDGSSRLLDIFAEQDSSGEWHEKWYTIQPTGSLASDYRTLTDVNSDGFPDLVVWHKSTGTVTVDLHSGNWNPGAPSTLFDVAHELTVATGWTGYRLAA